MRTSLLLVMATGCGVFGGGKSIEGTWEGDCETEDDPGNNYTYDLVFDVRDIGDDVAEGDGDFESTLVLPYYGYYYELELTADGDVRAEYSDDAWTIEGDSWSLEIEGESIEGLDTVDWTLVATRDGDGLTGEIELDLDGEVTVRGDCDLDLNT